MTRMYGNGAGVVLLLLALAKVGPAVAAAAVAPKPAAHTYVMPSCDGAAKVPGYEKCHP